MNRKAIILIGTLMVIGGFFILKIVLKKLFKLRQKKYQNVQDQEWIPNAEKVNDLDSKIAYFKGIIFSIILIIIGAVLLFRE